MEREGREGGTELLYTISMISSLQSIKYKTNIEGQKGKVVYKKYPPNMSTWMGNFGVEVRTQKKIENNRNKIYKKGFCFKTI